MTEIETARLRLYPFMLADCGAIWRDRECLEVLRYCGSNEASAANRIYSRFYLPSPHPAPYTLYLYLQDCSLPNQ